MSYITFEQRIENLWTQHELELPRDEEAAAKTWQELQDQGG